MAIPEPIPKRSDTHKVIRTAALNRIAHQLDVIANILEDVELRSPAD